MSENPLPQPPSERRLATVWVLLALLWGSSWLVIRIGLQGMPPFIFAGLRFLLAVPLLAALLWVRARRRRRIGAPVPPFCATDPSPLEWRLLLTSGFQVFAIGQGMQYWGQQHVPSGVTAIFYSSLPAVGLIFGRVRLGDPISPAKALGLLVGIVGVGVISYSQIDGGGETVGWALLALAVSVICYANAAVTVRSFGGRLDPQFIAMVQMGIGAVALLGASFVLEGQAQFRWTPATIGAMAWLVVVGSVVSFYAMYWLLRYLETAKVLSVLLAAPVIALLLGWFVLG